ncbi:MAG TPA: hypothetical protein VIO16_06705 [Dehalococcoidia bacterium]
MLLLATDFDQLRLDQRLSIVDADQSVGERRDLAFNAWDHTELCCQRCGYFLGLYHPVCEVPCLVLGFFGDLREARDLGFGLANVILEPRERTSDL